MSTKSSRKIPFADDLSIQHIFGHEAAEDEEPARLREYYFRGGVYDRITAPLPLRILVGHKGIGKSALFKIAMHEDTERKQVCLLVRPDDIVGLASGSSDFLQQIREWKLGLHEILSKKVLASFGVHDEGISRRAKEMSGKLLSFFVDSLKPTIDGAASLSPANRALFEQFIKTNCVNVYIDDLDRGWSGAASDVQRISALLNALRDLANDNPGLRFKVSLRSGVYFLVRTSDESTDKIEGSVAWYSWTNHEILALLVKRIETFFGRKVQESELLKLKQPQLAKYLDPVFAPRFEGVGKWRDVPTYRVLMSLIRKRPRDLVKLCTLAARDAHSNTHSNIESANLSAVFEEYSQGRLQDTINEFRTELPEIDRLLIGMKPSKRAGRIGSPFTYKTAELLQKLKDVSSQGSFRLAREAAASPKELAQFLYKINFLTARKQLQSGEILRRYFEENRYLSLQFADFGFDWEIHPAYRWALQPDTLDSIFHDLEVSADDQ